MNNFPFSSGSGFGQPPPFTPSRKQGGGETVGPNDPIFHQPVSNTERNSDDTTNLPRGGAPPGASYDPLTPFDTKTAGPDKDEARPFGSGPRI